MKFKSTIFLLSIIGLFNGCVNNSVYVHKGPLDKSKYITQECIEELSKGDEINHSSKIDKIVVDKKKRKLYTYKSGKLVFEDDTKKPS